MKMLTNDEISMLDTLVPYPMIIFNQHKVVFFNKHFDELNLDADFMLNYAKAHPIENLLKTNNILFTKQKKKKSFEITSQPVSIDNEIYHLSFFLDVTDRKKKEQKLRKMFEAREGILEINKAILASDNLQIILNNVLKNALKAIDKAELGAVFIIDNDVFKLATYMGFGKEIEEYAFYIKDAFLYSATSGKMNQVVTSSDRKQFEKSYPGKNADGILIQSTISAPIYANNSILGMLSIYSTVKDAFDEDDIKTMEYIQNNIEIAFANYLTDTEKDVDLENESITKIYNWNFICAQFGKYKERANTNHEKFYVVMINIDRLKRTNESFGVQVGDEVIIHIASEIIRIATSNDLVIRFDGDEFIGIFSNTYKESLIRRLDSVKHSLKNNPIYLESRILVPSFTYGIACYPEDGVMIEELIKSADEKMNTKKVNQW